MTSSAPSSRARASLSSVLGGRDHARAVQLRDLDRGDADARARGLDEHGLAGLHLRLVHDHLPRGEERQDRRRGLANVEPLGIRREVRVAARRCTRA